MIPGSLAANPRLDLWVGFETSGIIRVAVGKVEYGQGALTALAQIAAEELDVGMHRLDVVNPETGRSPDEGLTVGSMSIETSGAAIRQACAEARACALDEQSAKRGMIGHRRTNTSKRKTTCQHAAAGGGRLRGGRQLRHGQHWE